MDYKGKIQLILGPMFSGKTTELVRRIYTDKAAKRECIIIKYCKDTRYSNTSAATHDNVFIDAISLDILSIDKKIFETYDTIGIDEGQFFDNIDVFAEAMANKGKKVIIAALDGTFQRKPFGNILNVIPLAEDVIKLNAVCMICYKNAAFSKRITDETELEVIGGSEKYIAVCRKCYNKK